MARPNVLLFDSFESYAAGTDLTRRWYHQLNYLSLGAIGFDAGKNGGQALKLTGTHTSSVLYVVSRVAEADHISVGFWFKASARPVSVSSFLHLMFGGTSNSQNQVGIGMYPDGTLVVFQGNNFAENGGTNLGAGSTVLALGEWYWLEFQVYVHATAGTVHLKIGETTEISLTSQNTKPRSGGGVDHVGLIAGTGAVNWFDHAFVADATSGADFLGPQYVDVLPPTADTATKGFTADTGADNYARVDETQADGDTSYVYGGLGVRDDYVLTDLAVTPSQINAVQVCAVARAASGYGGVAAILVSGGTEAEGAASSFSTSFTDAIAVLNQDPATGAAWSKSGVDAAKIGARVAWFGNTTLTWASLTSIITYNNPVNCRITLSAANLTTSGTKVRVLLRSQISMNSLLTITGASIGQRSGATGNFSSAPTRLTFSGANGAVIPANGSLWSDWVDFTLDEALDHLVHVAMVTDGVNKLPYSTSPGAGHYVREYGTDDTLNQTIASYSNTYPHVVQEVQVQTASGTARLTQMAAEVLRSVAEGGAPPDPATIQPIVTICT